MSSKVKDNVFQTGGAVYGLGLRGALVYYIASYKFLDECFRSSKSTGLACISCI